MGTTSFSHSSRWIHVSSCFPGVSTTRHGFTAHRPKLFQVMWMENSKISWPSFVAASFPWLLCGLLPARRCRRMVPPVRPSSAPTQRPRRRTSAGWTRCRAKCTPSRRKTALKSPVPVARTSWIIMDPY